MDAALEEKYNEPDEVNETETDEQWKVLANWDHQKAAFSAVIQEFATGSSACLVKMFCGSGKSKVIMDVVEHYGSMIAVIVVPSLPLLDQFFQSYLKKLRNAEEVVLCVSSLKEGAEASERKQRKHRASTKSTTKEADIDAFLDKVVRKKVICVLYQSFEKLVDCMKAKKLRMDICCFDEAHRTLGPKTQSKLRDVAFPADKLVFFTATPKVGNGVDMSADPLYGKEAYNFSFLDGVAANVINPFEIRMNCFTGNTNFSIYEAIARSILATGNARVMTFHAAVGEDVSNTSVESFVDEQEFRRVFKEVTEREFPHLRRRYMQVRMTSISAGTKPEDRADILWDFENTPNDEVFLLCSCHTIGEGIDTSSANHVVWVDPKTSYADIIQNIGRVSRKRRGDRPSTATIPCWVDKTKYESFAGDPELCNEEIRRQMNTKTGDFSRIANVLAALKQQDPALHEACLQYPKRVTQGEQRNDLWNRGLKPVGDAGTCADLVARVLPPSQFLVADESEDEWDEDGEDDGVDSECEWDEEGGEEEDDAVVLAAAAKSADVCLQVHSDLFEGEPEVHNAEAATVKHVLRREVDGLQEYQVLEPLVAKERAEPKRRPSTASAVHKVGFSLHADSDVEILLSLDVSNLKECMRSCSMEVAVECRWAKRLAELVAFIEEHDGRAPVGSAKDKKEATLGSWVNTQKNNCKTRKESMADDIKFASWTKVVEQYPCLTIDMDARWTERLAELVAFIEEHDGRAPAQNAKDKEEARLATWVNTQKNNCKTRKESMADDIKFASWTKVVEQYPCLVIDRDGKWATTLAELVEFIEEHDGRAPVNRAQDKEEARLGQWVNNQKASCKANPPKKAMANAENLASWTKVVEQYLCLQDSDAKWAAKLTELVAFIENHDGRAPVNGSKDKEEAILASWVGTQKRNCKTRKDSMADDVKFVSWTEVVEQYPCLVIDRDAKWATTLAELVVFIENHAGRAPVNGAEDEEEARLARWVGTQKKNCDPRKDAMTDDVKFANWTKVLGQYLCLTVDFDSKWATTLAELVAFIEQHNGRAPLKRAKDKEEASLGQWVSTQRGNCKTRKESMADDVRFASWMKVVGQHPCLTIDLDAKWVTTLAELVAFIEEHDGRAPVYREKEHGAKDNEEARLANWVTVQKRNCKPSRKRAMTDDIKFASWTKVVEQYLCLQDSDAKWAATLAELVAFIKKHDGRAPVSSAKDKKEATLGSWVYNQKYNCKTRKESMADDIKFASWMEMVEQYPCLTIDWDAKWATTLAELVAFIAEHGGRAPSQGAPDKKETRMAAWVGTQKQSRKATPPKDAMKDPEKRAQWDATVLQFSPLLGKVREDQQEQQGAGAGLVTEETVVKQPAKKQKRTNEVKVTTKRKAVEELPAVRQKRRLGEFSVLNKRYTQANTGKLHAEFVADRTGWDHYHELNAERNALYDDGDISYNLVIARMDQIQTGRRKRVLDLGCGLGQIAARFKDDARFEVRGYDHVAVDEGVTACDITALPEGDASAEICVLSLALWGSKCQASLAEAHRVLESSGVLYVVEATRRWSTDEEDLIADRLEAALVQAGFTVKCKTINRFAVFECVK
jgi:superfamily II DNA or RNA helicase